MWVIRATWLLLLVGARQDLFGGDQIYFYRFFLGQVFFFWRGRGYLSPLDHPMPAHDPVSQNIIITLTSPPSSAAARKDDLELHEICKNRNNIILRDLSIN